MNVDKLLAEVKLITEAYDNENRDKGLEFNVFEILSVSSDEVRICRVLYELLNPRGSHGKGNLYLRYFVESVLNIANFEYKNVVVHREYLLSTNRRIDIVIENGTHFIPIEVKIYAEDQERQCYDYYRASKSSNVYYLTLFGATPSEYSAKGLTKSGTGYKEVSEISFEKDVLEWLNKCLCSDETKRCVNVTVVIEQLIEVIKKLTNQTKKEKYMDIQKLLNSSGENIQSAFAIEKSLKDCKIEMLNKVFSALEEKLTAKGFKKLDLWDYKGDRVNKFYDVSAKRPGISYLVKENIKEDVDLVFRVEIYERIYCGFCTPYKKERNGKQIVDVKELISVRPTFEDWWIYSEYLPTNSAENTINFRYPSVENNEEAYLSLYDDVKFELFINECLASIEDVLKFVK